VTAPTRVTTPRLRGRSIEEGDFDYVVEVDGDIRVQRTLFGRVSTERESRARLRRWIEIWEENGFGFWLFADASGENVGHGGLFPSPRETGEIEVGYVLKPAFWGRGYATEITSLSLQVGFDVLGMRRIIAIAQETNLASRRVMEKCGLTFETTVPSLDGVRGVRYAIGRP